MTLWKEVPLLKTDHSHLSESLCKCACACAWVCNGRHSREILQLFGKKAFFYCCTAKMVVPEDKTIDTYSSLCAFSSFQRGKQKGNVMGWLQPPQQKVQILKWWEQKIVWHIPPSSSVIKLPLKYTHKKPFAKLLSPPSTSHILSCHWKNWEGYPGSHKMESKLNCC